MKDKDDCFKVLLVDESLSSSILKDTFTFCCLIFSFWFSDAFVGGSVVLQLLIGITWFIWVASKSSNTIKRMTPLEAQKYLNDKYQKVSDEVGQ